MSATVKHVEGVLAERIEKDVLEPMADFQDPTQEWRRLFSELYGTFFLVVVAAGGGMMSQAFPNTISRTAAVVAPGLMVMGIIMFMGKISGAHLNPAVSIAFSLRGDFPWRRVPGYIVVQLIGATLAALLVHEVVKVSAKYGSNYPASGYANWQALLMEALLTLGLVSVILGTASGAQNIGIFGAIGVGAYIALAGLWGSPISGASMNPARTFGPDLVARDFGGYWVYVVGPLLGAADRGRVCVRPARPRRRQVRLRRSPGRPGNGGGEAGARRRSPLVDDAARGRGASLRSCQAVIQVQSSSATTTRSRRSARSSAPSTRRRRAARSSSSSPSRSCR